MRPLLLIPAILLGTCALGNDVLPVLRTTNAAGTVMELKDARIVKVEPDGVRVIHSGGSAKVPFERLPKELRLKYGFDASKAIDFRNDTQTKTEQTPTVPVAASASSTATAQATAPALNTGARQYTKEDVKAAWLRECETCFICPQDPQGAAKRKALADRVSMIKSGAWDSQAEAYAQKANAQAAAVSK